MIDSKFLEIAAKHMGFKSYDDVSYWGTGKDDTECVRLAQLLEQVDHIARVDQMVRGGPQ